MSKNKMNYVFFPFLMTISSCIYADFGLIQDKDGYVNVRELADLSSKVISEQKNGEIVSCVDDIVNNFCFINSSSGVNGYIYNNRINRFDGYNKIKLKKYDVRTALYRSSLYTVEISSKDADLNSKNYSKSLKGRELYSLYKGKAFYGTDGDLPTANFLQLNRIVVKIQEQKIIINSDQLENYFFPKDGLSSKNELADFQIYEKNNDLYIINSLSSGGAAQYNIALHIKDGKLVKNKVWKTEL
jgi:hypothetical protein